MYNEWSHGSVGRTYWPMYITTSSLPGSAFGSTEFRGLPHLPLEESVDRTVMKSPSGSPNSPTFRGCKTTWSHGSVGRAHRSHRWGHRFESCCDHHKPSNRWIRGFFHVSTGVWQPARKKYRDDTGAGLKKLGPSCILYLAFR